MTKKQNATQKINNGLKIIIERRPGLKKCYARETNKYLLETYGSDYDRSTISRIVNDKINLTPGNFRVAEGVKKVASDWDQLRSAN